jgi:hypothetical protein
MQLARVIAVAAVVCSAQGLSPSPASAQPKGNEAAAVSPEADQLLHRMSDFLGKQREFSVKVDGTTEEILRSGEKAQVHATGMVHVRRPNQLRIDKQGDDGSAQVFSDGKTFTYYSKPQNRYVSTPAAATLDATLSKAEDSPNIELPGADLLYTDSYSGLMQDVVSGESLGTSVVQGVSTHHLAFRGKEVDWQIWIEDGPRPLPRKYVITSKKIEGSPEYAILLSDWDLNPKLSTDFFKFKPPQGASQIAATPPQPEAAPQTPPPPRTPPQTPPPSPQTQPSPETPPPSPQAPPR